MSENAPTLTEIVSGVWNFQVMNPYSNSLQPAQTPLRYAPSLSPHTTTWSKLDQLLAAVTGQDVDEEAIAAGVLAGLTPERLGAAIISAGFTPAAVAAMIPAEMAQEVADVLHARLES